MLALRVLDLESGLESGYLVLQPASLQNVLHLTQQWILPPPLRQLCGGEEGTTVKEIGRA